MTKLLLPGTLLGGLTAFARSMVSWELAGWPEQTMAGFQKEHESAAVIQVACGVGWRAILPGVPLVEGMASEQNRWILRNES